MHATLGQNVDNSGRVLDLYVANPGFVPGTTYDPLNSSRRDP